MSQTDGGLDMFLGLATGVLEFLFSYAAASDFVIS